MIGFGRFLVLVNSIILFLLIVGFFAGIVRFDFPFNIVKPDYSVGFSPEVLGVLNENFRSGVEHHVCLDGSGVNHSFVFDRVVFEFVGDEGSAFGLCPSLASVHNHPKTFGLLESCKPSVADVRSWRLEASRGVSFFLIQCDIGRFLVYSSEDLFQGMAYEQ